MKGPGGRGEVEVAVSGVEGKNKILFLIIPQFFFIYIFCVLVCGGVFFSYLPNFCGIGLEDP